LGSAAVNYPAFAGAQLVHSTLLSPRPRSKGALPLVAIAMCAFHAGYFIPAPSSMPQGHLEDDDSGILYVDDLKKAQKAHIDDIKKKSNSKKKGNKMDMGSNTNAIFSLAPPPGLESFVEATLAPKKPVGLVQPKPNSKKPVGAEMPLPFQMTRAEVDTVQVAGLPNKLLTHAMLEAVLEQAGILDAVVSFDTEQGKQCGRAFIHFKKGNPDALEACLNHFHGCSWDASAKVSAMVVSVRKPRQGCQENHVGSSSARAMPKMESKDAPRMPPGMFMQMAPPEHLRTANGYMSASAASPPAPKGNSPWPMEGPAYVHSSLLSGTQPSLARTSDVQKQRKRGYRNRKPAEMVAKAPGVVTDRLRHRGISSDASTAVSDSETEGEERVGASKVFA